MEFEKKHDLILFDQNINNKLIAEKDQEQVHDFMKTYWASTQNFYLEAWTLEFAGLTLNYLADKKDWSVYSCATTGYDETLSKFHDWMAQMVVKMIFLGVNNRETAVKHYIGDQQSI